MQLLVAYFPRPQFAHPLPFRHDQGRNYKYELQMHLASKVDKTPKIPGVCTMMSILSKGERLGPAAYP